VKQRYLAIQVDSEETLDEQDLRDAVWNAVFQLFGEYGASQAGLFLIEYDKEKKQAVLRCSLKALPMVRASVTSVTKIRDKPAVLHVLRISGTIRALSKKASRLML
jgi:RNase P/RNase MRP subunit POP5